MRKTARREGNGFAISRDLTPSLVPVASLQGPVGRKTRKHPAHQIAKIASSLDRFGFVNSIVTDPENRVVAGWALVLAARELGIKDVPVIRLTDFPVLELRRLRLTLNRTSEDASWDKQELAIEIAEILTVEPEADALIIGFETAELDVLLHDSGTDQEDVVPPKDDRSQPISRVGDVWNLDQHRLICGDAENPDVYRQLLGSDKAEMMFADAPYNVAIEGHVSGLGAVKHSNFERASGEMSPDEFAHFLETCLGHAVRFSKKGAVHFVCMDWRHLKEILKAGTVVYWKLLNLCVWKKSNAGMGSHYRSQHELIFMFQAGNGPHVNNVQLGRYGRPRTNVWEYVSQSALSGTSKSKLALHPTVKPVAMIADAILDCSNRNSVILDPFGGAGTTIIAAEKTGRRARVIELDPRYVDVSIERWQRLSGRTARHAETGKSFNKS